MTVLLSSWNEIRAAGPGAVGGKAWALSRLAGYGFPVPAGMAIPAAVYRAWLAGSGLEADLLAATRMPDQERAAALTQLRPQLLQIAPGETLQRALREFLAAADWCMAPVAVRSSSPQEDSARASFAGIHASYLNVQGAAALLQAVVAVWASLWTPAAVAYRAARGIAQAEAAMAVLLMPLLPAVASGIGFTCDPANGRDDCLLIHANWGLGESLVGGQAAGDEIVLAEDLLADRLTVSRYTLGSKAVASLPAAGGGTHQVGNAPDQAKAPVMTEKQALALGELLRQVALALDLAQPTFDCEWAWDGRQFWLLQARPVTARGRCTYPELLGQPDLWSRGNTREVLPEPLSPIDWGAARRLVNLLLEAGYRLSGFAVHPGAQRAGLFHGRLYLNLSLIQWEGYAAFAVQPEAINRLVGGHQPEIQVPAFTLPQRIARILRMGRFVLRARALRRRGEQAVVEAMRLARRWRSEAPPADDAAFAAELRRQVGHGRRQSGLHFLQGAGGASLSLLVDLIDAHLPGQGHALASALLAGGPPSVTAQQSYDLIGVARTAMADRTARAWLDRHRRDGGDWRALPAENPFRRAFAEFLERYGHRGVYESYLRNPRWRERPDYLIASLPDLAATDLDALAVRQRESVAAAKGRVRQALPWWKWGIFKTLLRSAKTETNGREAARSALLAYAEPFRRLLLMLGARWAEHGWLSAPDDIFLLLLSEILAVLEGQRPGAALSPLLADRKALFAGWQQDDAPEVIVDGGTPWGKRDAHSDGRFVALKNRDATIDDGQVFHGIPVGNGVAVGPARLLHSPEEGGLMRRGDILVVASTDPAWTPLFLKAGGLVMETGGFLSHGAIVAREFGLPTVVNIPGIFKQLHDGEMLCVDGQRGIVSRLAAATVR